MVVVGVTGGIGTGKSTVCRMLEGFGATVLNVDLVGHESYRKGMAAYVELLEAFGNGIIGEDGEIDRKTLAKTVFQDSEARRKLNVIVWPHIREIIEARIHQLRNVGTAVVVFEAAVLIEAGWGDLADEIWMTVASDESVVERLKKRDGLQEEEIRVRLSSQLALVVSAQYADVVICTECSFQELLEKIRILWGERLRI